MTDIAFAPVTELCADLRAGKLSSRELLEEYLRRIDKHNPALNAVVTLDADRGLEQARQADDAQARGEVLGPLHGLPMTVKDALETAGIRTTSGAPELADHVPDRDADAVARLRAAGAVIFGKTNLPPYAGDHQSHNPIFGTTNNPWDRDRTPGGSSGGAAAAVAAGLTALEVGSDIGGSIRQPAHFCGVFGHKPTFGIVSPRGHIPGPPGTQGEADIAVVGPMARSADDLELALDVLAGPAPDRAIAWRLELPPPRATSLGQYRMAAWLDDPYCPVEGEVVEVLAAAVAALRDAGATMADDVRPVDLGESDRVYRRLLWAVLSSGQPEALYEAMLATAGHLSADDDSFMARTARDMTQRVREWNRANEARHKLRARWAEFFGHHDVLLCPATQIAAFPHDHSDDLGSRTIIVNGETRSYWEQAVWAGLAGVVLLPATVAPVGLTRSGLPVGLQVVAPYLEDRTAIDVARRITDVVGGYQRPPRY